MSRYVYEGYTKVWWVPTIATPSAPTVAEITAGVDLTPFIAKDGVTTPSNQNMVDSATINETFDAQLVGSYGGPIELTMFRDAVSADDDAWTACVYGTTGFIVIRRGVSNTIAITAAQKVEVYPSQMHQPVMQPSAANEQQRFKETFAVTAAPIMSATVAA